MIKRSRRAGVFVVPSILPAIRFQYEHRTGSGFLCGSAAFMTFTPFTLFTIFKAFTVGVILASCGSSEA